MGATLKGGLPPSGPVWATPPPPPLLEFGPPCWKDSSLPFGVPSDKMGKGRGSRANFWRREGEAGGLGLESNPGPQGPAPAFPSCVWPWTGLLTFLSFGLFFCHLGLINGTGVELLGWVNEPAERRDLHIRRSR